MKEQSPFIPTIFVIFGATGDLMGRKIAPALFHLYRKKRLPRLTKVIGFARRELTDEQFRHQLKTSLLPFAPSKQAAHDIDPFLSLFSYQQGQFEEKDSYTKLGFSLGNIDRTWRICANKLFYLAVPPHYYKTICKHLSASGLTVPCGPDEGWTRVLVEKPFGKNSDTAEDLDMLLGQLFKEEQIYRIDHYLGKEMLQNILTFRFTNNFLEESWNNKFIEKIEIRLFEKIGVEKRGAFYDGLGALRDMGQNHLLQMLSLITMDHPYVFSADRIRKKRAEILKQLQTPTLDQIKQFTQRAQYEGFRAINGVQPHSSTETFFRLQAFLDSPRWSNVPIILESGKRMPHQKKEIVVTFKHPQPCFCLTDEYLPSRKVTFSLEPHEKIAIDFFSKKPGLDTAISKKHFDFTYRKRGQHMQYVEEYEKLLLDAIMGDQTLFVSTDEVKSMWQFIDPVIHAWDANIIPLQTYKPDTDDMLQHASFHHEKISAGNDPENIGIIGLGKMGSGIAQRLLEKKYRVVVFNRTREKTDLLVKDGATGTYTLQEFVKKLPRPRIIWMMLPAGSAVDEMLFGPTGIARLLSRNDIVIDAGNSLYTDTIKRARILKKFGVHLVDIGVSGGPTGARNGACLMVGGNKKQVNYLMPILQDIAITNGVQFFEGVGAGHFVKMVHNGIEYGMMQAIGEGFAVLKKAPYELDLDRIANLYNRGSVIESRLINWLYNALVLHGEELSNVSGKIAHTGEGKWTIETAKKLKIATPIIERSLQFRIDSTKKPSYTGKVVSALREQFGGHDVRT